MLVTNAWITIKRVARSNRYCSLVAIKSEAANALLVTMSSCCPRILHADLLIVVLVYLRAEVHAHKVDLQNRLCFYIICQAETSSDRVNCLGLTDTVESTKRSFFRSECKHQQPNQDTLLVFAALSHG